jgi:two-component system, NarL family, nitrate/nitrite response regulator NarL
MARRAHLERNTPVLIVDPTMLFREGLRRILSETGFQIVWCSNDPPVVPLPELPERVIPLLIIGTEIDGAIADITQMKRLYPFSRVVLLLNVASKHQLIAAFRCGADTVVLRRATCEAFIGTLKLVLDGSAVIPSDVLDTLIGEREVAWVRGPDEVGVASASSPSREASGLSARELSVVPWLRDGLSNKEIARELGITEATVKVHMKALLRKARVRNRTQLVMWAIGNGLETLPQITT